jgi:hypothetical protein
MKAILMMSLVIFLSATIIIAADQGVLIHNGFGTGQDYIKMNQSQKRVYAMGAINGILLAPLFGASKEKMLWFESYVENMTDEQVAAILSKYLEDNPGRWHDGLHILMFSAIKEAHDKSRLTDK